MKIGKFYFINWPQIDCNSFMSSKLSILFTHFHLVEEITMSEFIREVIPRKVAYFWTLYKNGLDPPPQPVLDTLGVALV